MLKTGLIVFLLLSLLVITVMMYCALVVASREDEHLEHLQEERERSKPSETKKRI